MFVFTIKCSQNSKLHKIVGIQIKLVHEISSQRLETVGTKLLWSWGTHEIVGVYLYVYS